MQRGNVEAECFTLGAHRPQRSEGAEAAHSGLPLEHCASVAEGGARGIHTATARELIATRDTSASGGDKRQRHTTESWTEAQGIAPGRSTARQRGSQVLSIDAQIRHLSQIDEEDELRIARIEKTKVARGPAMAAEAQRLALG